MLDQGQITGFIAGRIPSGGTEPPDRIRRRGHRRNRNPGGHRRITGHRGHRSRGRYLFVPPVLDSCRPGTSRHHAPASWRRPHWNRPCRWNSTAPTAPTHRSRRPSGWDSGWRVTTLTVLDSPRPAPSDRHSSGTDRRFPNSPDTSDIPITRALSAAGAVREDENSRPTTIQERPHAPVPYRIRNLHRDGAAGLGHSGGLSRRPVRLPPVRGAGGAGAGGRCGRCPARGDVRGERGLVRGRAGSRERARRGRGGGRRITSATSTPRAEGAPASGTVERRTPSRSRSGKE